MYASGDLRSGSLFTFLPLFSWAQPPYREPPCSFRGLLSSRDSLRRVFSSGVASTREARWTIWKGTEGKEAPLLRA